jgi:hypothetical protein
MSAFTNESPRCTRQTAELDKKASAAGVWSQQIQHHPAFWPTAQHGPYRHFNG